MIYIFLFLATFIIWRSAYSLADKYNKEVGPWSKEKIPLWYSAFSLFSFGYIAIVPSITIYQALNKINLDITLSAIVSVFSSLALIVIFINKLPKNKK